MEREQYYTAFQISSNNMTMLKVISYPRLDVRASTTDPGAAGLESARLKHMVNTAQRLWDGLTRRLTQEKLSGFAWPSSRGFYGNGIVNQELVAQ